METLYNTSGTVNNRSFSENKETWKRFGENKRFPSEPRHQDSSTSRFIYHSKQHNFRNNPVVRPKNDYQNTNYHRIDQSKQNHFRNRPEVHPKKNHPNYYHRFDHTNQGISKNEAKRNMSSKNFNQRYKSYCPREEAKPISSHHHNPPNYRKENLPMQQRFRTQPIEIKPKSNMTGENFTGQYKKYCPEHEVQPLGRRDKFPNSSQYLTNAVKTIVRESLKTYLPELKPPAASKHLQASEKIDNDSDSDRRVREILKEMTTPLIPITGIPPSPEYYKDSEGLQGLDNNKRTTPKEPVTKLSLPENNFNGNKNKNALLQPRQAPSSEKKEVEAIWKVNTKPRAYTTYTSKAVPEPEHKFIRTDSTIVATENSPLTSKESRKMDSTNKSDNITSDWDSDTGSSTSSDSESSDTEEKHSMKRRKVYKRRKIEGTRTLSSSSSSSYEEEKNGRGNPKVLITTEFIKRIPELDLSESSSSSEDENEEKENAQVTPQAGYDDKVINHLPNVNLSESDDETAEKEKNQKSPKIAKEEESVKRIPDVNLSESSSSSEDEKGSFVRTNKVSGITTEEEIRKYIENISEVNKSSSSSSSEDEQEATKRVHKSLSSSSEDEDQKFQYSKPKIAQLHKIDIPEPDLSSLSSSEDDNIQIAKILVKKDNKLLRSTKSKAMLSKHVPGWKKSVSSTSFDSASRYRSEGPDNLGKDLKIINENSEVNRRPSEITTKIEDLPSEHEDSVSSTNADDASIIHKLKDHNGNAEVDQKINEEGEIRTMDRNNNNNPVTEVISPLSDSKAGKVTRNVGTTDTHTLIPSFHPRIILKIDLRNQRCTVLEKFSENLPPRLLFINGKDPKYLDQVERDHSYDQENKPRVDITGIKINLAGSDYKEDNINNSAERNGPCETAYLSLQPEKPNLKRRHEDEEASDSSSKRQKVMDTAKKLDASSVNNVSTETPTRSKYDLKNWFSGLLINRNKNRPEIDQKEERCQDTRKTHIRGK